MKVGKTNYSWGTSDWISFCDNLISWEEWYPVALFWIFYQSGSVNINAEISMDMFQRNKY